MLANLTGRPVIDQTELKGSYDITLDYAPETAEGLMMPGGPPPPGGPGGGEGRGPMAPDSSALSLPAAVQQELGLKLEAKKLPIENIIIDGIEKVPSEN